MFNRGCSICTNVHCNNDDFDSGLFIFDSAFLYALNFGCNCPNSPSNATNNGFVFDNITAASEYYYYYDTCTGFAGNVSADADNANDCCNFCCDRNDPYPTNTTTTATTTTTSTLVTTTTSPTVTPTNVGCKIVLDKWLYLSGLIFLVLTTVE